MERIREEKEDLKKSIKKWMRPMSLSRLAKRFVFLALMILPFGPSRFAAGAEPTRSEFTLNIDVYSGSVSSSELEAGFRLGLLALEKGYPAPTSFVRLCPRVIPFSIQWKRIFLSARVVRRMERRLLPLLTLRLSQMVNSKSSFRSSVGRQHLMARLS
jgi:hypothetical protein